MPPLETLSHVFVECPVAVRAWQWMRDLWQQLDAAAGPMPSDRRVLLLGQGQWSPSRGLRQLWYYLRILMLHSLWIGRCPAGGTAGHTAHAAVNRLVATVRHQVAMDWQRVQTDIRWGTGLPFTWFLGRDPRMTLQAFKNLVVQTRGACLFAARGQCRRWRLSVSFVSSRSIGRKGQR